MPVEDKALVDTIASLSELSRIDTLFGDLYLQRGKELLHVKMPLESYRGLLRMETELATLPNRIHNAMMQGKWPEVREMSGRMHSMKQASGERADVLALAKSVYEQIEIPVDPFSPGMQSLAGKSVKELPALRERGLSLLEFLAGIDPQWKDVYRKRHDELQGTAVMPDADLSERTVASPEKLQQEALEALEKGNFDKLSSLAGALSEKKEADSSAVMPAQANKAATGDLNFDFPGPVLERARNMGLTAAKAESRIAEYDQLASFLWHPTFADLETDQGRALRLSSLPLAADTPEALRSRIEMFVLHPFINSAGVRFLPPLVDEDALVEDFDEPSSGSTMPGSPLLESLGLKRRNSLTRLRIEEALSEHGYRIVKEDLGLDPYRFRLVCIPPDLHLRIGMTRGWGTQEIWTHFDGYMMTNDGKLHALAGGDVRFGGIYDMVGISRNYEADRIIVRFAVIQRRRMARRK